MVGDHPEGGPISVKAGRFGAYVNWGKVNATIPKGANADEMNVEQAVALLAARASGAPAGGGRVGGQYPGHGDIVARDGRYGAYVSLGKVNATLPEGVGLDTVSLEEAIGLIDAKGGPGKPARKTAAKKAAPKKAKAEGAEAKPKARKAAAKG